MALLRRAERCVNQETTIDHVRRARSERIAVRRSGDMYLVWSAHVGSVCACRCVMLSLRLLCSVCVSSVRRRGPVACGGRSARGTAIGTHSLAETARRAALAAARQDLTGWKQRVAVCNSFAAMVGRDACGRIRRANRCCDGRSVRRRVCTWGDDAASPLPSALVRRAAVGVPVRRTFALTAVGKTVSSPTARDAFQDEVRCGLCGAQALDTPWRRRSAHCVAQPECVRPHWYGLPAVIVFA